MDVVRIARAVRHHTGSPVSIGQVERAIDRALSADDVASGTYNSVTRLGDVAVRVSIDQATHKSIAEAETEIAFARRAHRSGYGLRVIWAGIIETSAGSRVVSCWPWASCAYGTGRGTDSGVGPERKVRIRGTRSTRPEGPYDRDRGASILQALRAASRQFVMIDIKLPNVMFVHDRAFLIDFDPEFVRSARCQPTFVAVQMLLIDLSAARVGSRVFSLSQIRAELRCFGASGASGADDELDSTATELACVTMETTAALDARFKLVVARVLAKYTGGLVLEKFDESVLRFHSGASGPFEFDVGSLVRLMRDAVGACYGPLVDRVGDGNIQVTPTRAARHEPAPVVDVHRARHDERDEVAEARVLAPVGQIDYADVVRDYGAYGLVDAPLVEVERRIRVGAKRSDGRRHRHVSRVGARSEVV
jgi:hypothetical protein